MRSMVLVKATAQSDVQWPVSGIPRNAAAWLTAVAKRRAIDAFRGDDVRERKHHAIAYQLLQQKEAQPDPADAIDDIGTISSA